MIKLMKYFNEAEKAYEFDPILGCRIFTLYNCYDNDYSFLNIWVAYENDDITACISIMSGIATVVACDKCNFEELADFFGRDDTIDFFELNENIAIKLNKYLNYNYKTRPNMQYNNAPIEFPQNMKLYTAITHQVFPVLKYGDPDFKDADFPSWYYDVHNRIKNHCCEIYGIMDESGHYISTGGYYICSPISAVVGGITTLPEHRKHGYASAIVKCTTARILSQCKDVYLIAASHELTAFYNKLGYNKIGEEWLIYRE